MSLFYIPGWVMLIEASYESLCQGIFSEQFYLDYRSESFIVNTLLPLLGTVLGRYFV